MEDPEGGSRLRHATTTVPKNARERLVHMFGIRGRQGPSGGSSSGVSQSGAGTAGGGRGVGAPPGAPGPIPLPFSGSREKGGRRNGDDGDPVSSKISRAARNIL